VAASQKVGDPLRTSSLTNDLLQSIVASLNQVLVASDSACMAAAVVGVVGLAFAVASTGIGLSIAGHVVNTQGLQVLYNEKEADALVESVSPV
jgi:hypothetical protein